MSASRGRGVLVAASFVLGAAVLAAPQLRPIERAVAHRLGVTAERRATVGQPLGRFRVEAVDGSPAFVAPRAGRPLLVNVFATWCPPCRAETPAFARLAPQLARAGIDVVGIDQSESAGAVTRFAADFALRYPLYIDASRSTATSLDARVIPTTIYIDGNDVVRAVHVGPLGDADLLALVRQASQAR